MMTATVMDSLQAEARSFVEWLEDAAGAPSVGDWVLIALAGAALYWVWSSLRAVTRIGPIEVSTVEHDATEQSQVLALTAALRERLHDTGLSPPPAVPTGTPQVSLIAAVEASNIPQGAWLSKLLQLLPQPPRPPEYKVTAVLLDEDDASEPVPEREQASNVKHRLSVWLRPSREGRAEPANNVKHRLSVWLRPSREGTVLLKTTFPAATNTKTAVQAAARMIYLHIADNAPHAFPLWARWRHQEGLEAYLDGCDLAYQGEFKAACEKLIDACEREPFNVLAPLRLATIREAAAAAEEQPGPRLCLQVAALRAYLDAAREWPHLVEARYRTSVLAGALAATYKQVDNLPKDHEPALPDLEPLKQSLSFRATTTRSLPERLKQSLGFRATTKRGVPEQLHDLAARESRAVLQLLQPWYVLVREQRLRNQFEPKGHQRRRLRHAVGISRHCVRVRKLRGQRRWWLRPVFGYHTFAVHVRHLFLGRGLLGGQALYNAACFNALLLDHHVQRAEPEREAGEGNEPPVNEHPPDPDPDPDPHRQRIQRRSLRLLKEAYREAPDELPAGWPRDDPDFEVFRNSTRPNRSGEWSTLVGRLELALRGRHEPEQRSARGDFLFPGQLSTDRLPFPDPPWGSPSKRITAYVAAAAVALALGLLVIRHTSEAFVIILVAVGVGLLRAALAHWKR